MFSLGYKTGLSFWVFVTNDLEASYFPEISSYREFNTMDICGTPWLPLTSIESSFTIESMFLPLVRSRLVVEKFVYVINPSSFIQRQKWSE